MQENCCSLALETDSVPAATLELQTALVKAGHSENMVVVGHALSLDNTAILLRAGADGLTHTFVDQPPNDMILELYKKTGAFCIPTLSVLASLTDEEQEERDKFAEIAAGKGLIDHFTEQNMCAALGMKAPDARLQYAYDTVRKLHVEGVDIVAGTDAVAGLKGTAVGPSLWMELDMYVNKCGMSVLEALSAATAVSAKRFKFDDRGTIEKGKRADLVLVYGDIRMGLQNIWKEPGIVGVWKGGFRAM
jgi:imidazolonepropionase-like amidohydrolase